MEKVYSYTITDQAILENVFKDEKLLMNHVVVPPGNVFPNHPTDAVVYALIVRGELSLQLADLKRHVYRKGQLVNIPKGVESELGNLGEEILELFVIKYDYDEPK